MEQILTIEEEKKYIADFVKRQTDARARLSEFSKTKIIEFCIYNFISSYWGDSMTIILEDNSTPHYKIEIVAAYLGQLPSLIKINIKRIDGSIEELSVTDAKIEKDGGDTFHIIFEVPENLARLLTEERTEVKVQYNDKSFMREVLQFGKTRIGCCVDLRFFVDMVLIYNEIRNKELATSFLPDEKIDEIFNYCRRVDAKQRKIEIKKEKSKQIEQQKKKEKEEKEKYIKQLNTQMAKLENDISQNITPRIIDFVQVFFTNPLSIPEIKALKEFCDNNQCESKNYLWLFSLDENYDKEKILEDIKQNRKGCNIFALLFASPQKKHNETTLSFIKDFETRFPNI